MYHFLCESSRGRFKDVFGTLGRQSGASPLGKSANRAEEDMPRTVKERRTALGLSRAELGEAAYVDRRILQLLELNQLGEHEAIVRVERALTALENGDTLPDFKAEVDALRG